MNQINQTYIKYLKKGLLIAFVSVICLFLLNLMGFKLIKLSALEQMNLSQATKQELLKETKKQIDGLWKTYNDTKTKNELEIKDLQSKNTQLETKNKELDKNIKDLEILKNNIK